MTNQPDDPRGLRARLAELDAAAGAFLDCVRAEPDRRLGVRVAEEAGAAFRRRAGDAAGTRRDVLNAAATEEALDLAGLAELAGGVSKARASVLRRQAREDAARRAAEQEAS
jgi:hypothetical protein